MFYHFGLVLVLAAATHGLKTATPPSIGSNPDGELDIRRSNNKIIGYKPIYGTKTVEEQVILGYDPIYGKSEEDKREPIDETSADGKDESVYEPSYEVADKPAYTYLPTTHRPEYELPKDFNFRCPKRYGYFRYEGQGGCDIYIACKNNKASLKVCPDGMHFKDNHPWAEYPCAYPPEAQCTSRWGGGLPARSTAECPRQFGNFPIKGSKFAAHDKCTSYLSCANGVAHVMNCTFGLVFNPELNICDWPEKVSSCKNQFGYKCPVARIGEEDMVINYRYEKDPECRYFFSCLNGNYRLLACDEGLLFDHRIGRCVEYDEFKCDYAKRTG